MLKSAIEGYKNLGGAHFPMNTDILKKSASSQIGYANRFEKSGSPLHEWRVAMYAREAHHLGMVIGQQQYFKEHGAKLWRRVLHPELSLTGPCPFCVADAELVHPIDMPFFDHPNGVCTTQGIAFESDSGEIEIPVPGFNKQGFIDYVKNLFSNIVTRVRRLRKR